MAVTHNLKGTSYDSFQISKSGPTIHRGTDVPVEQLGHDGDLYIRIGPGSNFYQKISGSWMRFSTNSRKIVPVAEDYYTVIDDDIILANTSNGPLTITLSTVATFDGKSITIKDAAGNSSVNPITIVGEAGQPVDGFASHVIDMNYESITMVYQGNGWLII